MVDRAFRSELQQPAVEVRSKGHTLVGHAIPSRKAEHLKTTGIGENRTIPPHECVQTTDRPPPHSHRAGVPDDRYSRAAFAFRLREADRASIPLTVAWVPTGMNAGVSSEPFGVSIRPTRALNSGPDRGA